MLNERVKIKKIVLDITPCDMDGEISLVIDYSKRKITKIIEEREQKTRVQSFPKEDDILSKISGDELLFIDIVTGDIVQRCDTFLDKIKKYYKSL